MSEPTMTTELVTIPKAQLQEMVSGLAAGVLMKCISGRPIISVDKVDALVTGFMTKIPAVPAGLTINSMVDMAYGTAKANGFHDQDDVPVTPESAYGQIAAMGLLTITWAKAVEAIRKPDTADWSDHVGDLQGLMREFETGGPTRVARWMMEEQKIESWQMRLLCWVGLMVTELAEAMEAVIKRDKANFVEELSDTGIRKGDTVGAINDDSDHPFYGIDLEAASLEKNERNKKRGYRHGGKHA